MCLQKYLVYWFIGIESIWWADCNPALQTPVSAICMWMSVNHIDCVSVKMALILHMGHHYHELNELYPTFSFNKGRRVRGKESEK